MYQMRSYIWATELGGICCSGENVLLPDLGTPREPLKPFLIENRLIRYIFAQHSCFTMTSFAANEIHESGYLPTFKVSGQVFIKWIPQIKQVSVGKKLYANDFYTYRLMVHEEIYNIQSKCKN